MPKDKAKGKAAVPEAPTGPSKPTEFGWWQAAKAPDSASEVQVPFTGVFRADFLRACQLLQVRKLFQLRALCGCMTSLSREKLAGFSQIVPHPHVLPRVLEPERCKSGAACGSRQAHIACNLCSEDDEASQKPRETKRFQQAASHGCH